VPPIIPIMPPRVLSFNDSEFAVWPLANLDLTKTTHCDVYLAGNVETALFVRVLFEINDMFKYNNQIIHLTYLHTLINNEVNIESPKIIGAHPLLVLV
jgi:hypothetical protein